MPGICVLLNQLSGGAGDGQLQEIRAALPTAEITVIPKGADCAELARKALSDGHRTLVAAGGDGTVSAVASVVVSTDAALGVLPVGTLNHFAKDLGIPINIEEAAKVIAANHIIEVDAGEVNERVFINNSGLGIYPRVVLERERLRHRGLPKWVALSVASAEVFRRFPKIKVRLTAEGESRDRTTPFVFVGNNEYEVEGLDIGHRPRLDGGQLMLYTFRGSTRGDAAGLLARALVGKVTTDGQFERVPVTELWIDTNSRHKSMEVSMDGEVVRMETPLHYRIRPGALRVIAPASA